MDRAMRGDDDGSAGRRQEDCDATMSESDGGWELGMASRHRIESLKAVIVTVTVQRGERH